MGGIFGFLALSGEPVVAEPLQKMQAALAHWGRQALVDVY